MPLDVVDLSRLQFAMTALYHFIFVPLTMGLVFILAIMESVYVITDRPVWRDMTKFWGTLFGINFAMGVATGITMEFQFGTNWAYYSHYVGDIFGAPLAIEGMMAFFLEATFVGMFFFGWERLSKAQHAVCTWILAVGTNLSALWILIANAWMQNPVGSYFNSSTMRMEVSNFAEVILNPVAQAKFVHTVSAGYVTGSIFVLAVSAWFMLRGRHMELAKRSMTVALSFGIAAALSVVVLGDESGYTTGQNQKMKIAAVEAMWDTEPAPAPLTIFGLPDEENMTTRYEVKIPWVLGLIATRSTDQQVPGIKELVEKAKVRIQNGIVEYKELEGFIKGSKNKKGKKNSASIEIHQATYEDLGYALLLKKYTQDITRATPEQIERAAMDTIPPVALLFWSFRFMVGIGFFFILLFGVGFYFTIKRRLAEVRWFQWVALLSLPLPWVASSLGWIVAEVGRQPWTIDGVLPTHLSASSTVAGNVWFSLIGFVVFYSTLLVVDVVLMLKYVKLGPKEASDA